MVDPIGDPIEDPIDRVLNRVFNRNNMQRFYLPQTIIPGRTLTVEDERIVYQVGKVLRMWKGDKFRLFNNKEEEFSVEILDLNRKQILVNVLEKVENKAEPKVKVSLYQSIPKKPALYELIIQKATEIGVFEIFPLITERTERKQLGKFERFQLIAMEAAEQCGRTHIPLLHHPIVLENALPQLRNAYMAYEYETKMVLHEYKEDIEKAREIQILIGPEGGLTQKEVDKAKKAGIKLFTFGPRILRTETAAISALSLILLRGAV